MRVIKLIFLIFSRQFSCFPYYISAVKCNFGVDSFHNFLGIAKVLKHLPAGAG